MTLTEMRVLVADDDLAVRRSLERALRLEGYDVALAADGRQTLEAVVSSPPDALVLDVRMPEVDGLEVCRRLRAIADPTPVLMLTAKDAVSDRVEGLDAGADDYLVKPFALPELLARLRALLRRWPADGDVLRFADLALDPVAHEARRGDRVLKLTRTEFALLELFLEHPRQVLPRSTIIDRVWGYDGGTGSNSLEVFIGYLRRKTEEDGEARMIQTVRGVGYVLRDE
ncbi:MAG TPA: response regulator transcription factor [Acidimicrobiales bacterium]|nr:response regulator transcription factor [Acidimicrobiales bacterium]